MNLFEVWSSPHTVYRWIAIVLGIGLVHASLPLLAICGMFHSGGLYPTYPNHRYPLRGHRRLIASILDSPRITVVLLLRIICALWLVATAWSGVVHPFAALGLFVIGCLLSYRLSLVEDNASSMNHILLATLSITACQPQSQLIATAGLWFIALQLCIAYVPGGVSKCLSANWRNGSHLGSVFADSMLRFPAMSRLLRRHQTVAQLLSWGVILLQLAFPLALCAPPEVSVSIVGGALLFHAGIAILMGLPNFLWTFAAGYPAIFWVNQQLRGSASTF